MLLKPDCIPCILTMSITAIRRLDLDEGMVWELYSDILTIPGLQGLEWNQTSPDIIEVVMEKIAKAVKNPDPFRSEKKDLNRRALKLYPFLGNLVFESSDPLHTAAKISILGNSIDFMMPRGTAALEDFILEKMNAPLSENEFEVFRQKLSKTGRIVYFGDNCGEIVFDKLFIETIKRFHDIEVTFVARSVPTLNDATLKEAMEAGLDEVATVIENGIDGPLPGTILSRCSPQVRELVDRSDLIVSKGGGNFDSLEEELGSLKTDITFMLLSKCHPLNTYFKVDIHQPIMASFYTS